MRAKASTERGFPSLAAAFFIPLILGMAYLNMGQTCCGCPPPPPALDFLVSKGVDESALIAITQSAASADGNTVAFVSFSSGQTLMVRDVAAGTTRDTGIQTVSYGLTRAVDISDDGRYVVAASNLGGFAVLDLDTPGATPQTIAAGVTLWSRSVSMSGDGRYIAFDTANQLVPEDTNANVEVYIWDRQSQVYIPVLSANPSKSNFYPEISGDGNWIVYAYAQDLYDETSHQLILYALDGSQATGIPGTYPSINYDGTKVAFGLADVENSIYVFDRPSLWFEHVSLDNSGVQPPSAGCSLNPSINGDGTLVSFRCTAAFTVHAPPAGSPGQLYVRDLASQTTKLASLGEEGEPVWVYDGNLSDDGAYSFFTTASSDIGPGDGTYHLYRVPSSHWELDDCDSTSSVDTTCDGVDDDCDGQVDEDYVPIPTTCGPGGCASGVTSCVGGQIIDSCDPLCGTGGTGGGGTGGTGGGGGGTGGTGTGGTGGTGTGGTGGGGGTQPGETVTYYDVDPLGSPVAATDSSANIVWRSGYEPFGHRLDETVGPDNALWFTGGAQEPVSQLIDLGSRQYNPEIGRFYGMDPVDFREGDPHSFNRYAYANNNPYRYVDPSGNIPLETVWDIANIAIGVGSFVKNVSIGNYAGAAVDAVGVVVDTGAAVLPYVPGGVGSAIRAKRAADAVDAAAKAANRADDAIDAARGGGKVYKVPGSKTPSNKPYIGRTKQSSPAKRGKRDGRDRTDAEIVDTYNPSDAAAGRRAEQRAINREGGVDKLDNKRNEIRRDDWDRNGIDPPRQ